VRPPNLVFGRAQDVVGNIGAIALAWSRWWNEQWQYQEGFAAMNLYAKMTI